MTALVSRPVRGEPLPRRVSRCGWDVVVHEGRARAARVVPAADRLCILVDDLGSGSPMAADLPVAVARCSTSVWCHEDGTCQVRTSWAPPALLVTAEGTRMVPETPGTPGYARVGHGDRLLILSATAFEAAPETVVRFLHEQPARLLGADPVELLETLFRGAPAGGGAILTRSGS